MWPTFARALDAGEPARALALCRGALLAEAGLDAHAWVLAARAEHERRKVRIGHWKR